MKLSISSGVCIRFVISVFIQILDEVNRSLRWGLLCHLIKENPWECQQDCSRKEDLVELDDEWCRWVSWRRVSKAVLLWINHLASCQKILPRDLSKIVTRSECGARCETCALSLPWCILKTSWRRPSTAQTKTTKEWNAFFTESRFNTRLLRTVNNSLQKTSSPMMIWA